MLRVTVGSRGRNSTPAPAKAKGLRGFLERDPDGGYPRLKHGGWDTFEGIINSVDALRAARQSPRLLKGQDAAGEPK